MDREINLDSIPVLEKQIEGHRGQEGIIIQLKRTRNSLLNVSTLLPPEILGRVFCWNAVPDDGDFGELSKGLYNFLLVCHHWFEVASCTPDLWNFWGNSIKDWTHRHVRCGTTQLNLVLDGDGRHELGDKLRAALRDRATRDTIRKIHLRDYPGLGQPILNSVISSIVVGGEGTRLKCVESFRVQNGGGSYVDVSAFFSQYRLPKLRYLYLSGCRISSWDLLKPQTTVLTALELTAGCVSPTPTISQLLSILTSNPLLRVVSPCSPDTHIGGSDRPRSQVPLRHLKRLYLTGESCHTFQLLSRLELPGKSDSLILNLYESSPLDLSQSLGPYFGDRFRRRDGFRGGGLRLLVSHEPSFFSVCAEDAYKGDDPTNVGFFAEMHGAMSVQLQVEEADRLCFDLISHFPWEQVVSLQTTLPVLRSEKLCVRMHSLIYLHLVMVDLSVCFVEPEMCGPRTFGEFLPGLNRIVITRPTLSGGDWSPLTNFLSHRAAVGNSISFLRISDHPYMDEDVVESIKCAVKVFEGEGRG